MPYKYCPSCREEYRHDFERCAHCDVALVHEDQLEAESQSYLPEVTELVYLVDGTRVWIEILAAKLRGAGVGYRMESMAALFEKGVLDPEAHPVGEGIFVQRGDHERAKEITSEHMQADLATVSGEGDSHEASENSCPAGGHGLGPADEECSDCGLPFLS